MRLQPRCRENGGGAVFVKIVMMKFFKKHWEVLSYLIFGVLTTLLNIVLYALFSRLFGYTAANSWGNVLDNALCILFAYCTNRAFVFRSRTTGKAMAKEFGTFVTCRLGTMVLDAAIMIVGGNLFAAQGAAALIKFSDRSTSGFFRPLFTVVEPGRDCLGVESAKNHTLIVQQQHGARLAAERAVDEQSVLPCIRDQSPAGQRIRREHAQHALCLNQIGKTDVDELIQRSVPVPVFFQSPT